MFGFWVCSLMVKLWTFNPPTWVRFPVYSVTILIEQMVTLSAVVQKRSLKIERKLYSMHRNKKTARGALVAVKRGHSLYKTTLRFKKGFALYKRV